MTRRAKALHSLSRKRIRASFNKYNLFNAFTWRKNDRYGTLYQQRFLAKQETRSYHGENLTETQFRNIFTGKLNAVSTLQSRRSGDTERPTPWALQTFVGLERRLDTAVFRAMFASSIRQAAQFILHGYVKVNGVKIRHPSFTLKPGDIFSVEPDKVLMALGRTKPSLAESVKLINRQIKKYNRYLKKCREKPELMFRVRRQNRHRHTLYLRRFQRERNEKRKATRAKLMEEMNKKIDQVSPVKVLETILRGERVIEKTGGLSGLFGSNQSLALKGLSIYKLVKGSKGERGAEVTAAASETATENATESVPEISETSETGTGSIPEALEAATATETVISDSLTPEEVRPTVEAYYPSNKAEAVAAPNKSDVKKLLKEMVDLQRDVIRKEYKAKIEQVENAEEVYDPNWIKNLPEEVPLVDAEEIAAELEADPTKIPKIPLPFGRGGLYGRQDPSKPYFTPWSPRQFLAPFAVLPHHIEISFLTCHAAYLRDPVARQGQSELISPFPLDMHERVHMWYSRKRRKNLE